LTVTVNEQLAVRLLVSVAVQPTVVTPFGKAEPDGGAHTTPTPGQLSLAVAAKVTIAVQEFGSEGRTMFAGQAMVGFWVSLTVTVKLQLDWLLELSTTVQFTVVTPFEKAEPDGGVHVGVKPPLGGGQLSVTVGAG
jgi:hypothetical protein